MKVTVTVILLSLLSVSTANADYNISWHTIDGGGGTSSGGTYTLTGTIGQHDAGTVMSSDSFNLTGGFWPGGPVCIVNLEHFANFAEYWLMTGIDLPADLYMDEYNIVNIDDLGVFLDYWLWYCPYDWPLK